MVSISFILKSYVTYSSVAHLKVKSSKVREQTRVFPTSNKISKTTPRLSSELMKKGIMVSAPAGGPEESRINELHHG